MSDLQHALGAAFNIKVLPRAEFTPERPSKRHTGYVLNPLPVPTVCRYCGKAVTVVGHKEIYGRDYGDWPYAYKCVDAKCDSFVGLHPFTAIPLGTLANLDLREARKTAKLYFNPIWEDKLMSRDQAYIWLAGQLSIPASECHIGWFDLDVCSRVIDVCEPMLELILSKTAHTDAP